jgi:hypothetical protein
VRTSISALVSVEVDSLTRSKRCAFRALDRDVSVNGVVARTGIYDSTNTIVQWIRLHGSGLITTVCHTLLTHEI